MGNPVRFAAQKLTLLRALNILAVVLAEKIKYLFNEENRWRTGSQITNSKFVNLFISRSYAVSENPLDEKIANLNLYTLLM